MKFFSNRWSRTPMCLLESFENREYIHPRSGESNGGNAKNFSRHFSRPVAAITNPGRERGSCLHFVPMPKGHGIAVSLQRRHHFTRWSSCRDTALPCPWRSIISSRHGLEGRQIRGRPAIARHHETSGPYTIQE